MPHAKIEAATIYVASITNKTKWIFVELRLTSGLHGWGEATAQGLEDTVTDVFRAVSPLLKGRDAQDVLSTVGTLELPTLAHASVASALDQAAWDVIARQRDVTVAEALGGEGRGSVLTYANINRRTVDRSPEGFARSAAEATAGGHEAVKIAPFDEVTPDVRNAGEALAKVERGLERMRAVRSQIGPDRRLMIDCHWRLDLSSSRLVIDAAAEAGLYWVECPIPEIDDNLGDIRALRHYANRRGVRLAGCEQMIRLNGFRPYLATGVYDVIMPDVKYAGGLQEFLKIADQAARDGVQVSPHNPSGPISHAMSLQLCSVLGADSFLEMQFAETPLFETLQSPPLPVAIGGRIALANGVGAGMELAADILNEISF